MCQKVQSYLRCILIIQNFCNFLINYMIRIIYFLKEVGLRSPMGSPISPLFADIIMDDLENDCLRILKDKCNCSPSFCCRFVDDIILCVQKKCIDLVLNIFNSQKNISTISLVNKTLKSVVKSDKLHKQMWNKINIIYKFNCKNRPATYIAKLKRALGVLKTNSESIVCEHQLEFNHEFDWENIILKLSITFLTIDH